MATGKGGGNIAATLSPPTEARGWRCSYRQANPGQPPAPAATTISRYQWLALTTVSIPLKQASGCCCLRGLAWATGIGYALCCWELCLIGRSQCVAWHARGQGFKSPILHSKSKISKDLRRKLAKTYLGFTFH